MNKIFKVFNVSNIFSNFLDCGLVHISIFSFFYALTNRETDRIGCLVA